MSQRNCTSCVLYLIGEDKETKTQVYIGKSKTLKNMRKVTLEELQTKALIIIFSKDEDMTKINMQSGISEDCRSPIIEFVRVEQEETNSPST